MFDDMAWNTQSPGLSATSASCACSSARADRVGRRRQQAPLFEAEREAQPMQMDRMACRCAWRSPAHSFSEFEFIDRGDVTLACHRPRYLVGSPESIAERAADRGGRLVLGRCSQFDRNTPGGGNVGFGNGVSGRGAISRRSRFSEVRCRTAAIVQGLEPTKIAQALPAGPRFAACERKSMRWPGPRSSRSSAKGISTGLPSSAITRASAPSSPIV